MRLNKVIKIAKWTQVYSNQKFEPKYPIEQFFNHVTYRDRGKISRITRITKWQNDMENKRWWNTIHKTPGMRRSAMMNVYVKPNVPLQYVNINVNVTSSLSVC